MIQPARIAVLGAGRMGHAIGYVLAHAGHRVRIYDPDAGAVAQLPARFDEIAALLRHDSNGATSISASIDLATTVEDAALIIEAAPERIALKQDLFSQLDALAPSDAILASNTSAIPIGHIAEPVRDKSRVVGAHFWNPPHLVRLVEVVRAEQSSDVAMDTTLEILGNAGWTAVRVNRDIPGFVGNRMQHALKREAIALVAAGVCDAETVDTVVKIGFGARLGIIGPLEQSDMLGLTLTRSIHDVVLPDLDTTPHAQAYLTELIASGRTGMDAGEGFRRWTPEQAEEVRQRLNHALAAQAYR